MNFGNAGGFYPQQQIPPAQKMIKPNMAQQLAPRAKSHLLQDQPQPFMAAPPIPVASPIVDFSQVSNSTEISSKPKKQTYKSTKEAKESLHVLKQKLSQLKEKRNKKIQEMKHKKEDHKEVEVIKEKVTDEVAAEEAEQADSSSLAQIQHAPNEMSP